MPKTLKPRRWPTRNGLKPDTVTTVRGLNHVTLAVADLDRAFAFYTDLLGLTPLARWDRGAYLLAGTTWICLSKGTPAATDPNDYSHFAFDISPSKFEQLSHRLATAGATIWQPNTSEGASLYFLDPDGHKLEIHVGDWQSRLDTFARKPPSGYISFVDD